MTTHEQIPPFLAEMPEPALASYLSPEIAPKPLPSGLSRVMPWRDELLPADLREYVRDVAERTQCPPDFVGVALVVAVSAVVGRKFTIHPKQHDDWMVVPNQWGVIIGRPSRIASLVRAAISGELDDGLIQRLQLAVYPDDVREWRLVDRWPNKAAAERVERIIGHLDRLPAEPRTALRFSPEAQEIFNAWYTRHDTPTPR